MTINRKSFDESYDGSLTETRKRDDGGTYTARSRIVLRYPRRTVNPNAVFEQLNGEDAAFLNARLDEYERDRDFHIHGELYLEETKKCVEVKVGDGQVHLKQPYDKISVAEAKEFVEHIEEALGQQVYLDVWW